MADLWESGDQPGDEAAFNLPGDEQIISQVQEVIEQQVPEAAEQAAESAPESDGPVRDELGRFASRAEESPDEDLPAEEAPAEGVDPAFEAYLAKYGGDTDKALRAAVEAQSELGRRAQEIGELRQRDEQWQQYVAQIEAQRQMQYQSAGVDWDEMIDEDPARATKVAAQQGNEIAYQRAIQAWNDVAPGVPEQWLENENLKAQVRQLAGAQAQTQGAKAVAELQQRYPDLGDHQQKMEEILSQNPREEAALRSGNVDDIAWAVENLYLKARGLTAAQTSETLAQTAKDLARSQAEEEIRVREEAAVASASRTHVPPPPSMAEAIAAEWPSDDALKSGWNVG